MKGNWKKLAVCLGIPLAVGGLAALCTAGGMKEFASLNQPPLSPPGWLFPVVWTILYLLMGYASYRILLSESEQKRRALTRYGIQLGLNFLWPILFFGFGWYLLALVELVALWVAVLITMLDFYKIDPVAGDLMLPYLLWVTFAGYLNFGIYLLNP